MAAGGSRGHGSQDGGAPRVESYERTVDAHIKNTRRKLEPDPHRPRYLLTVHSVGYDASDDPTTGGASVSFTLPT